MPAYETQQNIADEMAFQGLLEQSGFVMQRLSRFYPFDFFAETGTGGTFIEYKRRTHASTLFSDTYMPAQKIARSRLWARDLGASYLIFIQWTDALGFCDGLTIDPRIELSGRGDRGTWEPMVKIPVKAFRSWRPIRDQNRHSTVVNQGT